MNQEEREAWLAERKKGLGGTDIACIMMAGADASEKIGSFENSLFKIWSEKTGLFESEDQDNAILMRGRVMEKYVCEFYELHLGKGCNLWEEGLTWHPSRPRIFGTPDRLVEQDGTTDIPLDVEFQMRVYMEIFDTPYWDIATLFGLDDFRVYRLERDKELGESILNVAQAWWEKHVDGEIPPDVDATDKCMKVLGQLHSRVKDEPLREATVAEKDLHERLVKVKTEYKEIETKKKKLENLLRAKIGEDPGIQGIATWKKSKDTKTFDKRLFQESEPEMYEKYLIEKEGTRMLRVKELKNDNGA